MSETQGLYNHMKLSGRTKPAGPEEQFPDRPAALGAAIDEVDVAVARFRSLCARIVGDTQKNVPGPAVACGPMPLAALLEQAPHLLKEKTDALLSLTAEIESLLFAPVREV